MFGWVKDVFGHDKRRRSFRAVHVPLRVRGRYDAAVTTDENRRHWANADLLSANAAANPQVRRTLRSRARYEVANNSYARGIVLTLANDCVGTGPRLQMLTDDGEANRLVEQEFMLWADSVGLAEKLRTMRMARAESGEAFCMLVANPKVDSPVKLDLRLIEADQVATPDLIRQVSAANATDGIVFDGFGNPVEYHVLKGHPGDDRGQFSLDYDRVPAASMVHYLRSDRPGQTRGIPEITPALPLFAQLRRYTLAVLAAAETAADFAAVLFTDAPATAYTLSAALTTLNIREVTPNRVGNAGTATIKIVGDAFTADSQAQLIAPDGTIVEGQEFFQDSTTLFATFDLAAAAATPGLYDVVVTNPGPESVSKYDALTVVAGGTLGFRANLSMPAVTRPGRVIDLRIDYANTGTVDLYSPHLRLTGSADDCAWKLPSSDEWFIGPEFKVMALSSDGATTILRPGQSESLVVQLRVPFRPETVTVSLASVGAVPTDGSNEPIDWERLKREVRPIWLEDEAWDAVSENLTRAAPATQVVSSQ